jgi:hypothetical protein
MLEIGGWVALFLVLGHVALTLWLVWGERGNRNRIKYYMAASLFNVVLIAFFSLENRITEITLPRLATIKAQADQANQYVAEIKRIRSEVEQEQQAIKSAAADAQAASRLSKELETKNTQASKQLVDLANQMSVAAKTTDSLQLVAKYTRTVLAAQADDRTAFDQLQRWSTDSSFPYAADAGHTWHAISDNLDILMLEHHVPWRQGVDPAKFNFDELRKLRDSPEFSDISYRIGLIQYIASRSDIAQKDRLGFLIDVMQHDSSLRVVAYAGQGFAQVANLTNPGGPNTHIKPLARQFFFDWWKDNASKLPQK